MNWNIKDAEMPTWERLNGADNRYLYPTNFTYNKVSDACVLENTHKGYGWTFNLTLNAEPIDNLSIMAAYTHTVMKEVSGMPGSNASSAWQGLYTVNGPNSDALQNLSLIHI